MIVIPLYAKQKALRAYSLPSKSKKRVSKEFTELNKKLLKNTFLSFKDAKVINNFYDKYRKKKDGYTEMRFLFVGGREFSRKVKKELVNKK